MLMIPRFSRTLVFLLATALLVIGCAGQQVRTRSSVVDYLYPKKEDTVVQPAVPRLSLPLKVGIAFVPEHHIERSGISVWSGTAATGGHLTETQKTGLLDKVAKRFENYDFIKSIEVIPSSYLTQGGSFANLDQIRSMFGVDVIALVSYDQVQFTDEGLLSLTYWTIVGAYIISGEKNDTNTLMDTVIYDISSRKMLFRAPGASRVKGSATAVNLSEQLRIDSAKGFEQATKEMTANLDQQLVSFKEKVKQHPEQYQVVKTSEYRGGGGGAVGVELLVLLLVSPIMVAMRKCPVFKAHGNSHNI